MRVMCEDRKIKLLFAEDDLQKINKIIPNAVDEYFTLNGDLLVEPTYTPYLVSRDVSGKRELGLFDLINNDSYDVVLADFYFEHSGAPSGDPDSSFKLGSLYGFLIIRKQSKTIPTIFRIYSQWIEDLNNPQSEHWGNEGVYIAELLRYLSGVENINRLAITKSVTESDFAVAIQRAIKSWQRSILQFIDTYKITDQVDTLRDIVNASEWSTASNNIDKLLECDIGIGNFENKRWIFKYIFPRHAIEFYNAISQKKETMFGKWYQDLLEIIAGCNQISLLTWLFTDPLRGPTHASIWNIDKRREPKLKNIMDIIESTISQIYYDYTRQEIVNFVETIRKTSGYMVNNNYAQNLKDRFRIKGDKLQKNFEQQCRILDMKLNIEIDDFEFYADTEVVVNALAIIIDNAFKHGYAQKKGNPIYITLKINNDNDYVFTIANCGDGFKNIDSHFNLSSGSRTGAGIPELVKLLRGYCKDLIVETVVNSMYFKYSAFKDFNFKGEYDEWGTSLPASFDSSLGLSCLPIKRGTIYKIVFRRPLVKAV